MKPKWPDARPRVDALLGDAVQRQASDIHIEPEADGCRVQLRIDGLLLNAARVDCDVGVSMVARLMVMAELLTYRQDIPQEGRLAFTQNEQAIHLRLSVIPTTHGLRAVVRLPAELTQPRELESLGLHERVLSGLQSYATGDSGMLLLTGPAGSGKTTTIYALLEYIARNQPGLSVITLEDPVERDLLGVTQVEVSPFGELTYERALRSILRQDPQVLMLGEIRDAATASLAVQATLSGHRLIATLHAGTPGGAVARLLEMGLEPYQITSALFGVVSQRLVRRRIDGRYAGRVPVAELACFSGIAADAILSRSDAESLNKLLRGQPGYITMKQAAAALIESKVTDAEEVRRVLGDDQFEIATTGAI